MSYLNLEVDFKLLILVAVANSAPQVMRWASRGCVFRAVDNGIRLADGKFLFGPSKTWAGMIAAILASSLTAPLLSMPVDAGLHAGIAAMAGDLLTSFMKRRLGIGPSMPAPGLDQFAEAALPLLVLRTFLTFSWLDLLAVLLAFIFGELALAKILHHFGLRDRPI